MRLIPESAHALGKSIEEVAGGKAPWLQMPEATVSRFKKKATGTRSAHNWAAAGSDFHEMKWNE